MFFIFSNKFFEKIFLTTNKMENKRVKNNISSKQTRIKYKRTVRLIVTLFCCKCGRCCITISKKGGGIKIKKLYHLEKEYVEEIEKICEEKYQNSRNKDKSKNNYCLIQMKRILEKDGFLFEVMKSKNKSVKTKNVKNIISIQYKNRQLDIEKLDKMINNYIFSLPNQNTEIEFLADHNNKFILEIYEYLYDFMNEDISSNIENIKL